MVDGLSDVLQNLVEISQDGTSYSGDLLSTMDVLRNMTEIFRRAYHSPTSGDVQVSPGAFPGAQGWVRELPVLWTPGLIADTDCSWYSADENQIIIFPNINVFLY